MKALPAIVAASVLAGCAGGGHGGFRPSIAAVPTPAAAVTTTAPGQAATAAVPASAGILAPAKPSDESLTIGFDEDTASLSADANAQLDTAARLYRDARPEVMIVSGHSDTGGSEYGNLILSARRASAVKMGLVDRGIPADRLQIVAIGEAEPIVGVAPSRTAVVTWR